jgi:AraC-like DNA-binding protein
MLLRHDTFGRLCRARELLAEVREERLTIRDVARKVRISPFHFIRQFEALFGVTPHQFRIQSRLDQAKLLLARGEHSVTEVCMEVGFDSLGSFSDLFARRVGTAPSAYQRHARVMVQVPGTLPPKLFPGCLSLMACLPLSAFRNFQEACAPNASLECGVSISEGIHANQTNQHHGE